MRAPRPAYLGGSRRAQVTVVIVAIALAFYYTLGTLAAQITSDTPLAYLALVPVLSLLLAMDSVTKADSNPDLQDRELDYILGCGLLAAALASAMILPARMGWTYWLFRIDLLTLPLFAAGAISMLLGARILWRVRWALLFLLLAWPLPWTWVVDHAQERFTTTTLAGVRALLAVAPVARPSPTRGADVFTVVSPHSTFDVRTAPACAGLSGIVSMLLLGIVVAAVVRDRAHLKVGAALAAMVLIWVLNVARIFVTLASAERYGNDAAQGLRPVVGIVLFSFVVLLLLLAVRRLGLCWTTADPADDSRVPPRARDYSRNRRSIAVLVIVLACAAVAAIQNQRLDRFAPLLSGLGDPRMTSVSDNPVGLAGFTIRRVVQFPWAHQFLGRSATFVRYEYEERPTAVTTAPIRPAVYVDAITTTSVLKLQGYSISDCYRFGGYRTVETTMVRLATGLTGVVTTYVDPKTGMPWMGLSWDWPVWRDRARQYERVTVLVSVSASSPGGQATTVDAPVYAAPHSNEQQSVEAYILTLGRAIIDRKLDRSPGVSQAEATR